ncbi:tRNA preQ1(34) S-adenosylmethionine ribosyltransferase-isomerase QueA [Legionella sp. W05-934-2]|jgi:S-adenosylmethionine:tRNA ribosyltransferase-isomerase|uniref:tRNA preQ1(34) S-adenosylmethionine ribosyltransferase-isomerase QueA n=1 Tax=Legionella sp. W05-934-2 TaxID=1198649 RepID=UPI003461A9C9
MRRQDFHFQLPESLIAQYPLANRSDSRLLVHDPNQGGYCHQHFKSLPEHLQAGDVLVMNNTKVMPARLYGKKSTGGQVEVLIERMVDDYHCLAHIKASKAPKPGTILVIDGQWQIEVTGRQDDLFMCKSFSLLNDILQKSGHVPLPPYIHRQDEVSDKDRYQTVYAAHQGSVAAPTAGLHFDKPMLDSLQSQGVHLAYTTLHVGAGTFQPVRADNISDHKMHSECYFLPSETVEIIQKAKSEGRRVIAVGTTTMRTLESVMRSGYLQPGHGETDIFITPGYQFQLCDGLITNFHLPESTLLMLVSAFIGYNEAMALYQEAIGQHYRFFSYGDTSLLWRKAQ